MKNLYYCQDITKIDEIAQTSYKQPGIILMEQAGLKAWLYMKEKINKTDNIVIACGGGNNGGDALVIARCAFNDGYKNIKIITCSSHFSESFSIQFEIIKCYNLPVFNLIDDKKDIKSIIDNATVIIDGLTGLGLKNKLRDTLITLVEIINKSKAVKYSVDVPSGLSDYVNGVCIKADYTFCMGPLKALYYHPNNIAKCNTIIEINPSFPPQVLNLIKPVAKIDDIRKVDVLPLEKSAYKKTRGHLAVFGGSDKYPGALRLTSKAAFSSRCGLVTAFCDSEIYNIVATESPSIIVNKVETSFELSPYSAVLAGPGWACNREDLLVKILSYNKPTILDADGIRCYASLYKQGKIKVNQNSNLVFTPHIGELKVLADAVLDQYSLDNIKDFISTITQLSEKLKATIVCKSSVVFIATVNQIPQVIYNLNPSLGVAGSGDVLAGCIAAFLSYGLSTFESAKNGVILHINAGINASKELGFYNSEDLIHYIGKQLL